MCVCVYTHTYACIHMHVYIYMCVCMCTYICMHINVNIYILVDRVFANEPGNWGSILSRVIPKTKILVLYFSLLDTQHYKVRIKGKWSNPGKGVCPSLQ